MAEAMAVVGNPASPHGLGRHARELLEGARRTVAEHTGGAPEQVVFTAGATEANNLALLGLRGPLLVGAAEHASVLEPVPDAPRAPVDRDGLIDLAALTRLLNERRPRLISVMLANNETGVIQPVAEVARLAHAADALVHCDAAQALGSDDWTLASLGVDLVSLSAHKLGGPPGVGALVLRPELAPAALIRGGGQEGRRRAGTPNLPGILGFAAALAHSSDGSAIAALRARLEQGARAICPDLVILGAAAPRLPGIACLAAPGLRGEAQLMALDLAGIAVGIGAACSSGRIGPSHVLAAMGVAPELAACTIRVSLGWSSTAADVAAFLAGWAALHTRRREGRRIDVGR